MTLRLILPPKWIELNIMKRECITFIATIEDFELCQCGKRKFEHDDLVKTIHRPEVWNPAIHTRTMPTDAYGTLVFEGDHHSTKGHYVRLSYDTNPDLIVQLMTLVWGLEMPKLVISIRGGNSDFELSSRVGKILQVGLIKAARSTGAWIVTGGLNEGVNKHIGTALSHERWTGLRRNRLVTLGIAPWGVVENKEELRKKNKNVIYSPIEHPKSKFRALNPRHTNFLLVDNGSTGKEGGESYFRKRFAKAMASYLTSLHRGCHIPMICIVIEGGFYTLRNIGDYLYDDPPTPVVIFGGSGRTADLIAWVMRRIQIENNLESFKSEIHAFMSRIYNVNESQCNVLFEELKRIVTRKNMVTVYNTHVNNEEEFDQVILASIFRSQHWSPLQQLSLTLAWNRVDIAKNEVFVYGREFSKENLEHAMMEALISDRLDFVSLLLEHGLNMQMFLTPSRLEALYSVDRRESTVLRGLVKELTRNRSRRINGIGNEIPSGERLTLHDIGITMSHMMGHIYKSKYIHMNPKLKNIEGDSGYFQKEGQEYKCLHPFDDLFVWAVLTMRHDMALLLWRHGQGCLAKALVAVKLNKFIAEDLENSEKTGDGLALDFQNYCDEWETLSYELLDVCFKQDQKRARQLLTMELERWSCMTCLTLAVMAKHRMLLGHSCCQVLLYDLWMGALNVKHNGTMMVLFGIFFPPLIFFLEYKSTEELKLLPHQEKTYSGKTNDSEETKPFGRSGLEESYSETASLRTYDGSKSRNSLMKNIFHSKDNPINLQHSAKTKQTDMQEVMGKLNDESSFLQNQGSKQDKKMVHQQYHVMIESEDPLTTSEISIPGDKNEMKVPNSYSHHSNQIHSTSPNRSSFVTTKQMLGTWNKFLEFQSAPVTNFYRHAIAYLTFVFCLAYVILVPQKQSEVGGLEIYVISYMVTLGCEVVREFFAIDALNWSQKWTEFRSHIWHIADLFSVTFFMIGVGLRFGKDHYSFEIGMLLYRISSIYWNLRLYKYLGVHKFVGPKIVMMSKMLKHMVYFAMIILVVIIAFGLAREAIRFPDTYPTWRNIAEAFLEPYVMMFGEVDTDALSPQCGETDQPTCPVGYWVIPITWAVYMLVANILIVNVLIAVFNGIYSEIDAISLQIWMFQRFNFVMEFEQKPVLGPPLIILCHIYRIIHWLHGRVKSCLCELELEEQYDEDEGPRIIMGNDHRLKTYLNSAETAIVNPDPSIIVFDFEEDSQEIFTSTKIGLVPSLDSTIGIKPGVGGQEGWSDRQGLQQVKISLGEIFTELETHRVKLDKLIENWEQDEDIDTDEYLDNPLAKFREGDFNDREEVG